MRCHCSAVIIHLRRSGYGGQGSGGVRTWLSSVAGRLHLSPRGDDGERATDARKRVAVQVEIRVVAGTAVRIPGSVDCGALTHFQRSGGIAGAETIEREIDIGQEKFVLAAA